MQKKQVKQKSRIKNNKQKRKTTARSQKQKVQVKRTKTVKRRVAQIKPVQKILQKANLRKAKRRPINKKPHQNNAFQSLFLSSRPIKKEPSMFYNDMMVRFILVLLTY